MLTMSDSFMSEKCNGCQRKYQALADDEVYCLRGCDHKICDSCYARLTICPTCASPIVGLTTDHHIKSRRTSSQASRTAPLTRVSTSLMKNPIVEATRTRGDAQFPTTAVQKLTPRALQATTSTDIGNDIKRENDLPLLQPPLCPLSSTSKDSTVKLEKYKCSVCNTQIGGIVSVCTTCSNGKYEDLEAISNFFTMLETEVMCSDCRLDHTEDHSRHLFKKLADLKNELKSKTYNATITTKLNRSTSRMLHEAQTDETKIARMRNSLFSAAAALTNWDSSKAAEIEKDLQDALRAYDNATKKFFSDQLEFSNEMDRINLTLDKYPQKHHISQKQTKNKNRMRPRMRIKNNIPVPSAHASGTVMRETGNGHCLSRDYPPSSSALRTGSPPPPYSSECMGNKNRFYLIADVTDLRGHRVNESMNICLENVTDKPIQFEVKGSRCNFLVLPNASAIAPQATATLSCRRISDNPCLAKRMFIQCYPSGENAAGYHTIPIELD